MILTEKINPGFLGLEKLENAKIVFVNGNKAVVNEKKLNFKHGCFIKNKSSLPTCFPNQEIVNCIQLLNVPDLLNVKIEPEVILFTIPTLKKEIEIEEVMKITKDVEKQLDVFFTLIKSWDKKTNYEKFLIIQKVRDVSTLQNKHNMNMFLFRAFTLFSKMNLINEISNVYSEVKRLNEGIYETQKVVSAQRMVVLSKDSFNTATDRKLNIEALKKETKYLENAYKKVSENNKVLDDRFKFIVETCKQ